MSSLAFGTDARQLGTFGEGTVSRVKLTTCGLPTEIETEDRDRTHAAFPRTYHLLWRQHLLDHHAVPRERAPVQRVGPIRTEGTQAWCGCR